MRCRQQRSQLPCGYAAPEFARRYILRDDSPRADDCSVADVHATGNDHPRAKPYVTADRYLALAEFPGNMVGGFKTNERPDTAPRADANGNCSLKAAAHV